MKNNHGGQSEDERSYEWRYKTERNKRNIVKKEQTAEYYRIQELKKRQIETEETIRQVLTEISSLQDKVAGIVEEQKAAKRELEELEKKEKEEKRKQAIELAEQQTQQSGADRVKAMLKQQEDNGLDR